MPLVVARRDGDLVFILGEQLVASNRAMLRDPLIDAIDAGERRLIIDFAATAYTDSAGLGLLISLAKRVRERGGRLRLVNLRPELRTLLRLTRLDEVLDLEPEPPPVR